jgi:hypothetical protein
MLKYKPKQFWGMFKSRAVADVSIDAEKFAEFNQQLFYNPDITPDVFADPHATEADMITQAELSQVLTQHFKANKSSGLSELPLQCLKFLAKASVH